MNIKVEINTNDKNPTSSLKAWANVIFEDCFIIRSVKIIENEKGRFVNMPSVKRTNGDYRNICHPIKAEFHKTLTAAVLEAYDTEKA